MCIRDSLTAVLDFAFPAKQSNERLCTRIAHGFAHVNLVALDRQTAQIGQHAVNLKQRAARLRRGLARAEHRVDRQKVCLLYTSSLYVDCGGGRAH